MVPHQGSPNQTACPVGTYMNQTGFGGGECFECEVGRSTEGLTGQPSCPWCSVRNTYYDGQTDGVPRREKQFDKDYDVKTSIKKFNKDGRKMQFQAYEHFYQNLKGRENCEPCRSNKQPGAGFCDVLNGDIQCLGFYEEEEKCKSEQQVEQSIAIAYVFFSLLVTIGVPFMFLSGGLAAISHLWRKDIAVLIKTMRKGTEHGLFLMEQRLLAHQRHVRDKGVEAAFAEVAQADGFADLGDLRPKFELIGIRGVFLEELETLAATVLSSAGEHTHDRAPQSAPVRLTFPTFRVLLSILVHRLALARKHELYHEVFRFFDVDSGGTLDKEEMEHVAVALGRKFTFSELSILKSHADDRGGISPADFVQAMHAIDAAERRSSLLEVQNLKEERYEKAFELHKTDGEGNKPDFLDPLAYRFAVSSLGQLWSMEHLDLARDTKEHMSRFEHERAVECGELPPPKALHTLEQLESGGWTTFVMVLVAFQLAIEYDFIPKSWGPPQIYGFVSFGISAIFIAELIGRLRLYKIVHRSTCRFFMRLLNWIDFLTVLIDILLLMLTVLDVLDTSGSLSGMNANFLKLARTLRSSKFLRAGRGVRAARFLRAGKVFRTICRTLHERYDREHGMKISFAEFRRSLSTGALHGATEWPSRQWRDSFHVFDVHEHGFVKMAALDLGLLEGAGIYLSGAEKAEFRQHVDRHDGLLLFEDFVDTMRLYHSESVEDELLANLEDQATKLLRTWRVVLVNLLIFVIFFVMAILLSMTKLFINIYLIAQSFYSRGLFPKKLRRYAEIAAEAFYNYNVPNFLFFIPWMAEKIIYLLSLFTFEVPVDAGVTCEGMRAPAYLVINYLIVGFVILLFDSSLYVFFKIAPIDYNHQVSFFLHRLPFFSPEKARFAEEAMIKMFVIASERGFKNLLQIVISSMAFTRFMPIYGTKWHEEPEEGKWHGELNKVTRICETQYPGSETAAIYGASLVFWLSLPFMFHLLLNTFVFGLAPASIESRSGDESDADVEKGVKSRRRIALAMSQKVTATIVGSYSSHGKDDSEEKDRMFLLYGREILMPKRCAPSYCCFSSSRGVIEEEQAIEEDDVELFEHDPKFWQQPSRWADYFVNTVGGGSLSVGVIKYLYTMGWKLKMLTKITFGIWDDETTSNLQIKKRAQQLDIDATDDDERHQDMLSAVGEGHSIVWQFIPYCVFIAKAGEAFNANPLFVYDTTIETAIKMAKEQQKIYDDWVAVTTGKTPMPEGWIEVVSVVHKGRIHYLHVESGRTTYVRPQQEVKKPLPTNEPQLGLEDAEERKEEGEKKDDGHVEDRKGGDGVSKTISSGKDDADPRQAVHVDAEREVAEIERAADTTKPLSAASERILAAAKTAHMGEALSLQFGWANAPASPHRSPQREAPKAKAPAAVAQTLSAEENLAQPVGEWLDSIESGSARRYGHVFSGNLNCATFGEVRRTMRKYRGGAEAGLQKVALLLKQNGAKSSTYKRIVSNIRHSLRAAPTDPKKVAKNRGGGEAQDELQVVAVIDSAKSDAKEERRGRQRAQRMTRRGDAAPIVAVIASPGTAAQRARQQRATPKKVAPLLPARKGPGGAPAVAEDDGSDYDDNDAFEEEDDDDDDEKDLERARSEFIVHNSEAAKREHALRGSMIQRRRDPKGGTKGVTSGLFNNKVSPAPPEHDHASLLKALAGDVPAEKKEEEEQRGIWSLKVEDKDHQTLLSDDHYFVMMLDLPKDVEKEEGQGMLVWFSEDSVVRKDKTSVSFFSFDPTKHVGGHMKKHGDKIGYLEARRLFGGGEFASQFRRDAGGHEERKIADEADYAGWVGKGLFGESEALYVPSMTCVVCFHGTGDTDSQFTLRACFTAESPLMMEDALWARKFHWFCATLQYASMLNIVFSDSTAGLAFIFFLLLTAVDAFVTAIENAEETQASSGKESASTSDLLNAEGYKLLAKRFLGGNKKRVTAVAEEHLKHIEEHIAMEKAARAIQTRARGHLTRRADRRRLPMSLASDGEASDSSSSGYSTDEYSEDSYEEGVAQTLNTTKKQHWAARAIQKRIRGVLSRTEVKRKVETQEPVKAVEVRDPLPPGWVEIHNTLELMQGDDVVIKTRHYYVHQRSGRSQKHRPEIVEEAVEEQREEELPVPDLQPESGANSGKGAMSLMCRNCCSDRGESSDVEDVYCAEIVGSVSDEELRRLLLTGPGKARNLEQVAEGLSKRVVHSELSYDECMDVLREHARNVHEARWRIDGLRYDLNEVYVARLRKNGHQRFMKCLMEGHLGVVGVRGKDDAATGRKVLLQALGMRLDSRRDAVEAASATAASATASAAANAAAENHLALPTSSNKTGQATKKVVN